MVVARGGNRDRVPGVRDGKGGAQRARTGFRLRCYGDHRDVGSARQGDPQRAGAYRQGEREATNRMPCPRTPLVCGIQSPSLVSAGRAQIKTGWTSI